jgi:L,D-transpeptidase YcbB
MKKCLLIAAVFLLGGADRLPAPLAPAWPIDQIQQLRLWAAAAPLDALPKPSTEALDAAMAEKNQNAIDKAATDLALRLARMHLLGCATAEKRRAWHMPDDDENYDLPSYLALMLANDDIDLFFSILIPRHPDYAALRAAYADEVDPERKKIIARNMERWRWLPIDMGERFLIVNAARFNVTYWSDGEKVGTWPVIVGKPKTPTPIFATVATGVTFNPWWDIPQSIVAESIGALVRRRPAEARRRGFVWSNGTYRQKPGPTNSLGQMKLVMPNAFNVYLHDTPAKDLFAKDVRAFSHGCIRVGDALGFAATLLGKAASGVTIDDIVSGQTTQTIQLPKPVMVYVTYFTADVGSGGRVEILRDIYRRDGPEGDNADLFEFCSA